MTSIPFIRMWSRGRHVRWALLATIACALPGPFTWIATITLRDSLTSPEVLPVWELQAITCGFAWVVALPPRMPFNDRLGRPSFSAISAVAGTVVLMVAGGLPFIAVGLMEVTPRPWLPGALTIGDHAVFDVLPPDQVLAIGLSALTFTAIALLGTAFSSSFIGVVSSLLLYIAMISIQATSSREPFTLRPNIPEPITTERLILVALIGAAAMISWTISRGGACPLGQRLLHNRRR